MNHVRMEGGKMPSALTRTPLFFFFLRRQIKKEYGSNVVPSFPPKKIFTLTLAEVEQRREQLEKYMQAGQLLIGIKNRSSQYCFSLAF